MGSRQNPGKGGISIQDKLECAADCCWAGHASVVLSAAFLGNVKLLQHCATLCANPFRIQDSVGRNSLHVAASCGHLDLIQWLIARKKVKVNVQDWESKWTALHRSMFYGQLGASVLLIKHGASLGAADHDGWTPLTLLNTNREIIKDTLAVDSVTMCTWGRNPNTTLGHDRSREHPERLDLALPHDDHAIQIILCKFHTVILTSAGQVLSCGHGLGGRLGHNSEQTVVAPHHVKAMSSYTCVGVAAARDHTVILTKGGGVYTCGINDAHQLGLGHSAASAPSKSLAPKQVKALKSRHVIAVGAGRFHTAMCTETELYTVGRNLGQLGYKKGADTQVTPRVVPGINLEDGDVITVMSASDSATAVLSKQHHVFVCTDFIVRHIRFGFLEKVSCKQFEVCASLSDRDHLRKVETEPTKVLLLDTEHKLWVWQPMKKGSPCIVPGFSRHHVVQFSLGRSLTVVTREGEVFKGSASMSGGPISLHRVLHIQNARAVFTDFKANNFAYLQNIYRSPFLPEISQGTLATDLSSLLEEVCLPGTTSDVLLQVGDESFTAHKFFLSSQTRNFPSQLSLSESTPPHPLSRSCESSSSYKLNGLCDSPAVFDAFLHYIYGSHIRLLPLYSQGMQTGEADVSVGDEKRSGNGKAALADRVDITPDTSFASLDDNDLTEEYDNYASNELPEESGELERPIIFSTPKRKTQSSTAHSSCGPETNDISTKVLHLYHRQLELQALLRLAVNFGLTDLQIRLERLLNSQAMLCKPQVIPRPPLELRRQGDYSDLTLTSIEGKSIQCHKCVLVARSEYFRSMLLMGWKESLEGPATLSLPENYDVLRAVIDYIYTDKLKVPDCVDETMDWIMSVLILADQLLLTRLKELCELSLARALNLRNAVELLEFSETYSARQLKKSCLQFVCINASCFFEGRYSDSIPVSLLEELSQTYQALIPSIEKRVIKFEEPRVESLPESYFRDSGLGEEMFLSGPSDNEEEGSTLGTDIVADSSQQSVASIRDVVSPRAASNSRRKRRRKNSHNEAKSRQNLLTPSVPPLSPTERELSGTSPSAPSPPIPTSPVEEFPPPLSSPISTTHGVHSIPKSSSPSRLNNSSTPIAKEREPSSAATPQPTVNAEQKSFLSGRVGSQSAGSKSKTVPIANHARATNEATKTPASAPGKASKRGKKRSNNVRTRLAMKFDDAAEGPKTAWNEIDPSTQCKVEPTSPAAGSSSKGAWTTFSVPLEAESLRDIMAREEEISTKQLRQRSPSCGTSSSSENVSVQICKVTTTSLVKSEPISVGSGGSSRNKQKDGSLSPCVSPPPSNPWKMSGPSSPTVSMRDVMAAEAKEEQKQSRQRASLNKDKVIMKSLDTRLSKQLPTAVPHQPVSFASIIKSQEKQEKRTKMTAKKAFPLIQIEERAISELKRAYSADDNADEYITVERYPRVKASNHTTTFWGSSNRHSMDNTV